MSQSVPASGEPKPRLLLVEDDASLRAALRRALEDLFEVEEIADGALAVEAIAARPPDVVLSDIALPGLSGLEVLRAARLRDVDVPVILVTAHPSEGTLRAGLELGAVSVLHKPVPSAVLRTTLLHAAKLSRLARLKRGAASVDTKVFDRALASLLVHHQPIVDARTQQTMGYEVLMRPQEKDVPHPGAMLHLAERLDRVRDLGRRVRELAAASLAAADGELRFVNLHPQELLDPELFDASSPLGAVAPSVVLEITERAALTDVADTRARIRELRAMGYRIAIDDLGAGYAGLTCFATLEPEIVKLDMTLIREIHASPVRSRIVETLDALCHELGMRVVAEGIETVEELRHVVSLDCDLLQGYHLGRPAAALAPSPVTW